MSEGDLTEKYDLYVKDCLSISSGQKPLTKDEYELICEMKHLILSKDKDLFFKRFPELRDKFKNVFGCDDAGHAIMCMWAGLL